MISSILACSGSHTDTILSKTLEKTQKNRLQAGLFFLILIATCIPGYAATTLLNKANSGDVDGVDSVEKLKIDCIIPDNDGKHFTINFNIHKPSIKKSKKPEHYKYPKLTNSSFNEPPKKVRKKIRKTAMLISKKTPLQRGLHQHCLIAIAEDKKDDQSDKNRESCIEPDGDYISIWKNEKCELFLAFWGLSHPDNTYTMETISLPDGSTYTINQTITLHRTTANNSTENSDQVTASATPPLLDSNGFPYDAFIFKLGLTDDQIGKIRESFQECQTSEVFTQISLKIKQLSASKKEEKVKKVKKVKGWGAWKVDERFSMELFKALQQHHLKEELQRLLSGSRSASRSEFREMERRNNLRDAPRRHQRQTPPSRNRRDG